MWLLRALLVVSVATLNSSSDVEQLSGQLADDITNLLATVKDTMTAFEGRLEALANHQLAQDVYTGERLRNDGQSGIKLVRTFRGGTRPYHIPSHSGNRIAGMHNHANFKNVLGLGELVAVMNGVEFRTRHNDYHLVQPSTVSSELFATEQVTPPPVPYRVLNKPSVEEQTAEMREWFKAWRDQDYSVRDYRDYFNPILCYLEGAWYDPNEIPVDLFHSDRHSIESPDFIHLQKQFKYTVESGRKDPFENISFLPRSVHRVVNGTPEFAQWNYRVLCQPLSEDLPLNRFRVVDDVAARMSYKQDFNEYSASMRARYQLNPYDEDTFSSEGPARYGLVDKLMAKIPGLNNHGSHLTDDSFGATAFEMETENDEDPKPVNMAYYNRWLMTETKGAFGLATRHRGFNDDNLFVAQTTQRGVLPTELEFCRGAGRNRVCEWQSQRFSYAIPLEVVYMTPLTRWNPYDLEYKGDSGGNPLWDSVRLGGRNGKPTAARAYNGTNNVRFYQTPSEFYEGGQEIASDPADTTGLGATAVLDRNEEIRMVRDSGHRMFFPEIPGVGILRQRYPIMSIYGEGSSVWKELEAMKDIVLDSQDFMHMYRQSMPSAQNAAEQAVDRRNRDLILELMPGTTGHGHLVHLSHAQLAYLRTGETLQVETEEADSHIHDVTIRLRSGRVDNYYASDIQPTEGHSNLMAIVQSPEEDVNVN